MVSAKFKNIIKTLNFYPKKNKLGLITTELSELADKIDQIVRIINTDGKDLQAVLAKQKEKLRSASTATHQITSMIKINMENSLNCKTAAEKNVKCVEDGSQELQKLTTGFEQMIDSNEIMIAHFEKNQKQFEKICEAMTIISDKTKIINEIAFQAKLLSFNASVEAARAGEHGKCFSVVAEEIGNLAKLSGVAANEIFSLIENNTASIQTDLLELKGNLQQTKVKNNLIVHMTKAAFKQTKSSFERILEFSGIVGNQIFKIVNAVEQQNEEVSQIDSDVNALDKEARQAEKMSQNQMKSSAELSKETEVLNRIVSDQIGIFSGRKISNLSAEVVRNSQKDFEIIDVRNPHEYNDELGHIEGSRLITLGVKLDQALKELDPQKKYLFVCRSGGRSSRAARNAQRSGFTHVYNLSEGMRGWHKGNLSKAS